MAQQFSYSESLEKALDDMQMRVEAIYLPAEYETRYRFALYMLPMQKHIEPYLIMSSEQPQFDHNWLSLPYDEGVPKLVGWTLDSIYQLPPGVLVGLMDELDESRVYERATIPQGEEEHDKR